MGNTFRISLVLLLVLLTGCTSYKTITRYSTFEDRLLEDCEYVTPPNHEVYIKANVEERVYILSEYYVMQIGELAICNARLNQLREDNQRRIDHNKNMMELLEKESRKPWVSIDE